MTGVITITTKHLANQRRGWLGGQLELSFPDGPVVRSSEELTVCYELTVSNSGTLGLAWLGLAQLGHSTTTTTPWSGLARFGHYTTATTPC